MKIVIIGFGSAGYSSLMAIKRENPKHEIVIIDPKESDLMHPCGLPYSLGSIIDKKDLSHDIALSGMGVSRIKAHAKYIDSSKKEIIALSENKEITVSFDKAIISVGSKPVIPPIANIDSVFNRGIYTLTNTKDLNKIEERVKNSNTGIVIGAGAIGIEAAFYLKKHLKRTVLIEMREQVLPGIIDSGMSVPVQDYLADNGIEIILNSQVEEVTGADLFDGVIFNGNSLHAEVGILAAGFRSNTDIAEISKIEFDNNGIAADKFLRTSADNVYAAGDCMCAWSVIDGKRTGVMLATSAYKQGTVAGNNAAGGNEEYRGSAGTFVSRIADLEIAGTGYNTETAKSLGYNPVSGRVKSSILPNYFPGGSDIIIKVIAEKETGMILGAQAVGKGGAAERINLISMALEHGLMLNEMTGVELAYCPSVSEVYDPLMRAVDFARRKIRK